MVGVFRGLLRTFLMSLSQISIHRALLDLVIVIEQNNSLLRSKFLHRYFSS